MWLHLDSMKMRQISKGVKQKDGRRAFGRNQRTKKPRITPMTRMYRESRNRTGVNRGNGDFRPGLCFLRLLLFRHWHVSAGRFATQHFFVRIRVIRAIRGLFSYPDHIPCGSQRYRRLVLRMTRMTNGLIHADHSSHSAHSWLFPFLGTIATRSESPRFDSQPRQKIWGQKYSRRK